MSSKIYKIRIETPVRGGKSEIHAFGAGFSAIIKCHEHYIILRGRCVTKGLPIPNVVTYEYSLMLNDIYSMSITTYE